MKHYTKSDRVKRDEAVRKFAYEHPHLYHREIALKFGISRSQVSSILRLGGMDFKEIIKAINIKPYYESESVVIYHSDNRLVLPLIPDKSVDLVLTDPPYEIVATGGGLGKKRGYAEALKGLTEGFENDVLKQFDNWMCFCGKEQIVDLINLAKERGRWMLVTWNKPDPTPLCNGNYLPDTEYIIHRFTKLYGEYKHRARFCVMTGGCKDFHPTGKPPALISKLISVGSDVDHVILDPFLGSGTTAYCAKKLGRKCIGIEIEEKYCEIAAKRLSQEVMRLE